MTLTQAQKDAIREIVERTLGVTSGEVYPSARLVHNLGADDFDLDEIIIELEDMFNVKIKDMDLEIATVQSLYDAVEGGI